MKNGIYFLSILDSKSRIASVWDPHTYREKGKGKPLSFYAEVTKLGKVKNTKGSISSYPIEYKNISGGKNLTFDLSFSDMIEKSIFDVKEQEILFGTMRAYLGNVLVTPKAEWIDSSDSLNFKIKSEFVKVTPFDGYHYFWWLYFQSKPFLNLLPLGGGGTRPRLKAEDFSDIVVDVPAESVRKQIHQELLAQAKTAWQNQHQQKKLMERHRLA